VFCLLLSVCMLSAAFWLAK